MHDHAHHHHAPQQLRPVPELLAPAGGPAAFDAALAAGADAIYCGLGEGFNARRSAENFSEETFAEACRKAHLAGTRVYVTVNVVIKTGEMPQVLALVRQAWLLGADAFIIQDWGLIDEIHKRWPHIECHASTQANVHDARGVVWAHERGFERVTTSRELTFAELTALCDTGVEIEGFCHGALCFCYSGICLMSVLRGDRSANRGMCAQPCRLLYQLVDEHGENLTPPGLDRPLCPKDNCTIDDLPALIATGVGSLKVEGRMKAPDYVYAVVSAYREALDDYARGVEDEQAQEVRHDRLRRAFNRDFTNAYLYGRSGNEMMSYERSNNRGELVGEVVDTRDLGGSRVRRGGSEGGRERFRKVTRAEVSVRLSKPVGAGDLLEIRPVEDPSQFLTALADADAEAGETIVCKTTRPMAPGCPVRVIRSQAALDAAQGVRPEVPRKRPVVVNVMARLGKPFTVELTTPGTRGGAPVSAVARGFEVEAARTRAVTPEEIREHVERMGATPFEPTGFAGMFDQGVGMAFSAVHKGRAEACQALEEALLAPYAQREEGLASVPDLEDIAADLQAAARAGSTSDAAGVELCVLAPSLAVAQAAQQAGATRVYATADALVAEPELGDVAIPWLDEVCREVDHERLDGFAQAGHPVAVGNVSELALAAERGTSAEVRPCVPIHNTSTLHALEAAGAQGLWLSGELSLGEACALARAAHVPVGLVVYGRERAMTSEHCVLQVAGKCVHDCARCHVRTRDLALRDKDGNLLPVRTDLQGRSRIYAAHPLDATPQVGELVEAGVTRLMVDATLLASNEAARAVTRAARALAAVRDGRKPEPREAGATSGHLFSPID